MKSKKSNQEWETLVNQYKDSKLSIVKFGQETGIKPSTLNYWVKKLRTIENKSETKLVRISKPIISEKKLFLSYDGLVIEIPNNISTKIITSLINTVRESCSYAD